MNFFIIFMFLYFFLFFSSFYKKLICLLSLEFIMVLLIGCFFFHFFNSLGTTLFSTIFIFVCFMVLDSILGISLLICSSRNSAYIYVTKNFF